MTSVRDRRRARQFRARHARASLDRIARRVATETSSESPTVAASSRGGSPSATSCSRSSARGGMGQVYMGVTGEAGRPAGLRPEDHPRPGPRPGPRASWRPASSTRPRSSPSSRTRTWSSSSTTGWSSGQGYLAMEFVEGKTLTELWNRCAQRGVGFPIGHLAVHRQRAVRRPGLRPPHAATCSWSTATSRPRT